MRKRTVPLAGFSPLRSEMIAIDGRDESIPISARDIPLEGISFNAKLSILILIFASFTFGLEQIIKNIAYNWCPMLQNNQSKQNKIVFAIVFILHWWNYLHIVTMETNNFYLGERGEAGWKRHMKSWKFSFR